MKPWIDGEFVISLAFGHIYYLTHDDIGRMWCEEICAKEPRFDLQDAPAQTNCLVSEHPAKFRRFNTDDLIIGDEFDYNHSSWAVIESDAGKKLAARDGTKDRWELHHFKAHEIFVTKIALAENKLKFEPIKPIQSGVDPAGEDGDSSATIIGSILAGGKYPDDFIPAVDVGDDDNFNVGNHAKDALRYYRDGFGSGVASDSNISPVLLSLSLVPEGSWVKMRSHHRPIKYLSCPDKWPILENIHGFKFHFKGVTLDTLVEIVPDPNEKAPAEVIGITERLDALRTYLDDANDRINAAKRDVDMIKRMCGLNDG